MLEIVPIIFAYLIGGIPSGLLIARAFGVSDIRQHGSGNIGATNVWRTVGGKAAFWVYVADISKGVIAVFCAKWIVSQFSLDLVAVEILVVATLITTVLGNIFPIYLRFKGGKGVNTALGGVLGILPIETAIAIGVFIIVVLLSHYISAGSILGVLALFVATLVERLFLNVNVPFVYIGVSGLLTLLIIFTHRKNIARIFDGSESRFSFGSRQKEAGSNV